MLSCCTPLFLGYLALFCTSAYRILFENFSLGAVYCAILIGMLRLLRAISLVYYCSNFIGDFLFFVSLIKDEENDIWLAFLTMLLPLLL